MRALAAAIYRGASTWNLHVIVGVPLLVAAAYAATSSLLRSRLELASFQVTVVLAIEVTLACLLVSAPVAYLALRHEVRRPGANFLVATAVLSLLVPTIARSLAFSALFAFYGPVASALRALRLWPADQPLESSHLAVVLSLVTLYLPLCLVLMADGARRLGRIPELARSLGGNPWQATMAVVLPGLARPATAAGLVIFSQVLGVIITPRILGSQDVTIALVIDDYLKRSLAVGPAVRLALTEIVFALPLAVVAASFLEETGERRVPTSRTAERGRLAGLLPWALGAILLVVPLVLVLLSLSPEPVLSLGQVVTRGPRLTWYGAVLSDRTWYDVAGNSLLTWGTCILFSLAGGLAAGVFALRHERVGRSLRWLAFVLLFLPQNALGVMLFMVQQWLPRGVVRGVPPWLVGGLGEAVVVWGLAYIILGGTLQRISPSLRIAASLGAGPWRRLYRVAIPQLSVGIAATLLVGALVHLDDVIFVRYLPLRPLRTFSTELFERARYTSSPDLAAACVLLWIVTMVPILAFLAWKNRTMVVEGPAPGGRTGP